jgi:hypothetical protein
MSNMIGQGYYEPSLQVQPLPRCPHCGSKHPLAFDPPLRVSTTCPRCQNRLPHLPPAQNVDAVLSGWHPSSLVARALLAVGKFLVNWWKDRQ